MGASSHRDEKVHQARDAKARSVAIVTKAVPHYRVPFLNGLEARLRTGSTALTVFADYALPHFHIRDGLDDVNCAVRVTNLYLGPPHRAETSRTRLPYWQPIFGRLLGFDLVVVDQTSSALLNHLLFVRRRLLSRSPKIGLWGHGANMQMQETGLRRWIKATESRYADHWFAYTRITFDVLRHLGVQEDIITIVNNSVDTSQVRAARALDATARMGKRSELGLGSSPLAVLCARLSKDRGLPFVVEACRKARERVGDIKLLVIGDGDEGPWLRAQAEKEGWIRPLGALYGAEKAEILALCDVFLLPSMVGLSILDSFAAGLPLLSARFANHGPEIAYLNDGVNGLLTDARLEAYSEAIVRVLSDRTYREELSRGARQSAETYSLDAMIENVARGIERTLESRTMQ